MWIFLILLVILFAGVHFIAPYTILQPTRVICDIGPDDIHLHSEALSIRTEDQLRLYGYWIHPPDDALRGIIMLVHGIGGCKESYLGTAGVLAKKGIASVLFDNRAHGKSEGRFCTYGFYEKRDISQIVDLIKSRHPDLPLGIWGSSLGGAIAIQAMEVDKRIEFGIIESTFTDLSQIVFDYKKRLLKNFGVRMISEYALWRAGKIAGFNPKAVRPLQSVVHVEQPVLIAHGDEDLSITVKYGQLLFDKLGSADKEIAIIQGGGHMDLHEKGGADYEERVIRFIEKNLASAV